MKRIFGMCFILFGPVGMLIGALSIYDPIGIKLSDSTDPFGEPVSIYETIVIVVIFLGVSALGVRMAFEKK